MKSLISGISETKANSWNTWGISGASCSSTAPPAADTFPANSAIWLQSISASPAWISSGGSEPSVVA